MCVDTYGVEDLGRKPGGRSNDPFMGARVRWFRKANKWTVTKLAEEAGLTKSYVSKLIAADPDMIMPDGFYQTPQEADEIVIRVDHGVVLIEVEQESAD